MYGVTSETAVILTHAVVKHHLIPKYVNNFPLNIFCLIFPFVAMRDVSSGDRPVVSIQYALHILKFTVEGEDGSLHHYALALVFPLVCPPIKPQNQSRDTIKLPSRSFLAAFILPSINRLLQEGLLQRL